MDLASGMSAAEKQRRIADELRKRAMAAGPEGQMVSGHYVAPSWTQQIAPLVNAGLSAYADKRATKAEEASNQAINAAKQQWQSALPQAVAQQTQPFMAEGIDGPENIPGTSTITQQAQPLTTGRILKHTLAGLDIPGNEKAAALYNAGALADLTREDNQQARKEDRAAATLAAAQKTQQELEYKREALAQQATLAGNNEALRRDLAEQSNALARQIAAATDATRRAQIDLQRELGHARIDAQKERDKAEAKKDAEGKPLSVNDLTKLQGIASGVQASERFRDTFQDSYSGPFQEAARFAGTYVPGATENAKATSTWWNDYQGHKNKTRHELFGSALTATEKAEWEKSDITTTMDAAQIRKNLNRRAELERQAYDKLEAAARAPTRGAQLDAIKPPAPGTAPGAPKVGEVKGGHVFLGGDPANPASWGKQ